MRVVGNGFIDLDVSGEMTRDVFCFPWFFQGEQVGQMKNKSKFIRVHHHLPSASISGVNHGIICG